MDHDHVTRCCRPSHARCNARKAQTTFALVCDDSRWHSGAGLPRGRALRTGVRMTCASAKISACFCCSVCRACSALRVVSASAKIPARPSRLNAMLMPGTRRNVCARPTRPTSAGFSKQPPTAQSEPSVLSAAGPEELGQQLQHRRRRYAELFGLGVRRLIWGPGHAGAPALPLAPFEVIGGVERRSILQERRCADAMAVSDCGRPRRDLAERGGEGRWPGMDPDGARRVGRIFRPL